MDDRDDSEPGEAPHEPITERVRIIGAQPAGELSGRADDDEERGAAQAPEVTAGLASQAGSGPGSAVGAASGSGGGDPTLPGLAVPAVHEPSGAGASGTPGAHESVGPLAAEEAGRSAPSGRNGGDPLQPAPFSVPEPATAVPDMPHWTDPPTGQVPAVLDRRGDDDEGQWSGARDHGPSWREHSHEWDDSTFEPALLADDETRVGALEETPVEERRPWEFDDLQVPGEDRPGGDAPTDGESWWDDDEEAAAETVIIQRPATGPLPTVSSVNPVRPAAEGGPEAEGSDRGVASISSSPLRVSTRDPLAASSPVSGRGRGPAGMLPHLGGGRRDGSGRDMPVAIATGVGFVLLALLCFSFGTVPTLILATIVVVLASAECYAALRRSGRHPATLLGLVATVGLMVAAYTKGVAALPLVLVLVLVASMVWYLVGAERGPATEGIAGTLLAFVWVGVLGSYAALMLAPGIYPHRHGVAFLLGAAVAAVGADVGALAIGSWLGRHPLAPNVSPNKTWEGVIGGGLVAIAVSAAITGQVHPWTVPKAALLGLVVAVLAPVGDLCESLVKRDLGLKDMGSMLPGHGGVLDRVDAILFVLPATFYLVRVLNLG